MNYVYADHAATTKISETAKQAMISLVWTSIMESFQSAHGGTTGSRAAVKDQGDRG